MYNVHLPIMLESERQVVYRERKKATSSLFLSKMLYYNITPRTRQNKCPTLKREPGKIKASQIIGKREADSQAIHMNWYYKLTHFTVMRLFLECDVGIEKPVLTITVVHQETCRVIKTMIPRSHTHTHTNNRFFRLLTIDLLI